jgi:hypothetical protein
VINGEMLRRLKLSMSDVIKPREEEELECFDITGRAYNLIKFYLKDFRRQCQVMTQECSLDREPVKKKQ